MSYFKTDINGSELLLSSIEEQVMMEWEQPYMEASIDVLQPTGHVLEIGFGCGYSATQIMKYNPKSYTVIECDSLVIKKTKEWAKKYPGVPIYIVEGRWQEKLHTLQIFDEIYFDDFPLDITKESKNIVKAISQKRLSIFVDLCIQNHTRIGSKISFYLSCNPTDINFLSSDTMPFVKVTLTSMNIEIPENCKYRNQKEQKCTIPLLEKIKEFDFMEAQRLAVKTITMQCGLNTRKGIM